MCIRRNITILSPVWHFVWVDQLRKDAVHFKCYIYKLLLNVRTQNHTSFHRLEDAINSNTYSARKVSSCQKDKSLQKDNVDAIAIAIAVAIAITYVYIRLCALKFLSNNDDIETYFILIYLDIYLVNSTSFNLFSLLTFFKIIFINSVSHPVMCICVIGTAFTKGVCGLELY